MDPFPVNNPEVVVMADKPKRARIVWSREEWLRLLVETMPKAAEGGRPLALAIEKLQKKVILDKTRRRTYDRIFQSLKMSPASNYMDELKAMSEQERTRWSSVEAEPVVSEPVQIGGVVRWTTRELALLAREIDTMGAERPLHRRVIEAQDKVLPAGRRRPHESIEKASYPSARPGAQLHVIIQRGRENIWTLPEVAKQEPVVAGAEAFDAAASTYKASVETSAPAAPPRALSALAQGFAQTLAEAFDVLLASHMQQVMQAFENKLASATEAMGMSIAREIQASLGRAVHATLEAELGGPLPSPQIEPQGDKPDGPIATPTPEAAKALRVDVVGLTGSKERVWQAFEGQNIEVRFVEVDKVKSATLRSPAIMCAHRISHSVIERARAQGVEFVRVNGSHEAVIDAIQQIKEQRHATLPSTH